MARSRRSCPTIRRLRASMRTRPDRFAAAPAAEMGQRPARPRPATACRDLPEPTAACGDDGWTPQGDGTGGLAMTDIMPSGRTTGARSGLAPAATVRAVVSKASVSAQGLYDPRNEHDACGVG